MWEILSKSCNQLERFVSRTWELRSFKKYYLINDLITDVDTWATTIARNCFFLVNLIIYLQCVCPWDFSLQLKLLQGRCRSDMKLYVHRSYSVLSHDLSHHQKTDFNLMEAQQSGKGPNLKVAKWWWKRWSGPIFLHIYDKRLWNYTKNQWKGSNFQI